MQPWVVYCKFIYEIFWRYESSKITNQTGKNYCNHHAHMQWKGSFNQKSTFRQPWSIWYSRTKHAIQFYLRNRTTAQTEYVMGSTVNILSEFWVYKLSFLKRHPSIQKSKNNETARTYRGERNIWYNIVQASLTNQPLKRWRKNLMKAKVWNRTADLNTNHTKWSCWKFGQF
jgi:hypothetical protein